VFDFEQMQQIAGRLYALKIEQYYGKEGMSALAQLLEDLNVVHRSLAYEVVQVLTIYVPIRDDIADLEELVGAQDSVCVPAGHLPQYLSHEGTVVREADGKYRVWPCSYDLEELANHAVVYHFNGADHFMVGASMEPVDNPTNFPSIFGIPTFIDLNRALDHYSSAKARYTRCPILRDCWFRERQIILSNTPERYMRKSLAEYLDSTLRDHENVEVREEQIVDDSHPVDIKVTWSFPPRLALLEVKWLGDSVNGEGTSISTRYRDQRARDGAQQICDYLDANRRNAPTHTTMGYLVVFDARRRGVSGIESDQTLSSDDAVHYRFKEIEYNPRLHETRPDFAEPVRFWLEPVVHGV
jgi:hypothetical protein